MLQTPSVLCFLLLGSTVVQCMHSESDAAPASEVDQPEPLKVATDEITKDPSARKGDDFATDRRMFRGSLWRRERLDGEKVDVSLKKQEESDKQRVTACFEELKRKLVKACKSVEKFRVLGDSIDEETTTNMYAELQKQGKDNYLGFPGFRNKLYRENKKNLSCIQSIEFYNESLELGKGQGEDYESLLKHAGWAKTIQTMLNERVNALLKDPFEESGVTEQVTVCLTRARKYYPRLGGLGFHIHNNSPGLFAVVIPLEDKDDAFCYTANPDKFKADIGKTSSELSNIGSEPLLDHKGFWDKLADTVEKGHMRQVTELGDFFVLMPGACHCVSITSKKPRMILMAYAVRNSYLDEQWVTSTGTYRTELIDKLI